MKADQILDWIVAIVVLLFIFVPLIGSMFAKKRIRPEKKIPKHHIDKIKEKRKELKKNIGAAPTDAAQLKKVDPKKNILKHGNLKQAIILSEILKRPYLDD